MQETSELYKRLLSNYYRAETRIAIGKPGVLLTEKGARLTVGGIGIRLASSGADVGYTDNMLQSVETQNAVFSGTNPEIGCCVRREIDFSMLKPVSNINGLAQIRAAVRLTDGKEESEWIPQGVFYADEIEEDAEEDGVKWLRVHGYDVILFAEQDYPAETSLDWPAKDVDVVREIAAALGTSVDPSTIALMTDGNMIQYPSEYSCREVLGYIAAMYAGCFITNNLGQLRLVCLGQEAPGELDYYYLADKNGYALTFGGEMILV